MQIPCFYSSIYIPAGFATTKYLFLNSQRAKHLFYSRLKYDTVLQKHKRLENQKHCCIVMMYIIKSELEETCTASI